MSKNIKKNSESKKNIKKPVSKTSKTKKNEKIIKKKPKKVEEEFEEETEDSLEDFNFEQEVEEKNKIEREIKGEKETPDIDVDKEILDNEINKTISNKIKEEPKKAIPAIKKTRKETVIDSIQDAYSKLELPEEEKLTPAQLKATKINLLEKKLADLTEKIVSKLSTNKVATPETSQTPTISNELATNALFNVNIIMTTFIENLAETGRQNEATKKYIPDISGVTNRLLKPEKEKQLRECLRGIIDAHGESIKPFMSPIAIYMMFMVTTMSEQVTENLSKNSKEPITHIE